MAARQFRKRRQQRPEAHVELSAVRPSRVPPPAAMSDVYLSAACEGSSFVGDAASIGAAVDDDDTDSDSSAETAAPDEPQEEDEAEEDEGASSEDEEGEECPFCSAVVGAGALGAHVSTRHRLGCLRCRRLLASEDELEAHLQRHEEQFVCSLCPQQQFEDEADYEFHRMSQHDALKCPKCTQVLLPHEFPAHTRACQRKQVLRPLREEAVGAAVVLKRKRRGGIVGRSRGGGRPAVTSGVEVAERVRRASKGAKERGRRAELGAGFEELRLQVPMLRAAGATATKQAILREALLHIRVLEEQSHTYHKVRLLLKRQQQRMNQRVQQLEDID